MGFVKGLCSLFLFIYNLILMIAGIIIMIKGLYMLAYAHRMKQELGIFTLGFDNVYKDVGVSFVVPAAMMMVIAYFGMKASSPNVTPLVIYIGLIILQMSASSYGVSQLSSEVNRKSNVFSVFSYFNKLLVSSELGGLQAVAYPELALQISLLIASVYLLFNEYNEKRKLKQHIKNARRLQVLEALLEAEKGAYNVMQEREVSSSNKRRNSDSD